MSIMRVGLYLITRMKPVAILSVTNISTHTSNLKPINLSFLVLTPPYQAHSHRRFPLEAIEVVRVPTLHFRLVLRISSDDCHESYPLQAAWGAMDREVQEI